MKTTLLLIVLLTLQLVSLSQNIKYEYDDAGNRELRHVVVLQSATIDTTKFEKDVLGEQVIKVYPNPTKGWLSVNINRLEPGEKAQIMVYSMTGAMLIRKDDVSTVNRLDLTAQRPGMYIMRLILGAKTSEWKIIKE